MVNSTSSPPDFNNTDVCPSPPISNSTIPDVSNKLVIDDKVCFFIDLSMFLFIF